jgi:hypothetical protein
LGIDKTDFAMLLRLGVMAGGNFLKGRKKFVVKKSREQNFNLLITIIVTME